MKNFDFKIFNLINSNGKQVNKRIYFNLHNKLNTHMFYHVILLMRKIVFEQTTLWVLLTACARRQSPTIICRYEPIFVLLQAIRLQCQRFYLYIEDVQQLINRFRKSRYKGTIKPKNMLHSVVDAIFRTILKNKHDTNDTLLHPFIHSIVLDLFNIWTQFCFIFTEFEFQLCK